MAQDHDLDRLKAAQDSAFERKQAAHREMQACWQRLTTAKDVLNRAYQEKQRAHAVQEAAWQEYQRVRQNNGSRIDLLNAQQEQAYQNMKAAFDNASSAHDQHDGASARMYADQGHEYKQESQGYVEERRSLVQEIRDAKERHEATKPDFQYAKTNFDQVRAEHDRLRADHQRQQEEFQRRKIEFDQAVAAFQKRLEAVRAESKRKKEEKRSIAERAGVPLQYRDNVLVSREFDGTINIYFGGVGQPDGLGHGHYALDASGNVTYMRDPFDPHGTQNFTNPFGTGDESRLRREVGGNSNWTAPVHGITADGKPITASFGREGTKAAGEILYRDGHAQSMKEFYGPKRAKEHEHDDGKGGGTDRGKAPNIRGE